MTYSAYREGTIEMNKCRHCGQNIRRESTVFDVWVDNTGGDVCCADKFADKNENGSHEPNTEDEHELGGLMPERSKPIKSTRRTRITRGTK